MKLTPLNKRERNRYQDSKWIIDHFPVDILFLDYVEPYGGLSILLQKALSNFEAINETTDWNYIYNALRDESQYFISRIKRIKYIDSTFHRYLKRKLSDDYVDNAIKYFVIYRMSVGGHGKKFGGSEITWKNTIKLLPIIAERLKHVHIFNKKSTDVIRAFNNEESFIFVTPPDFEDENANEHVELADLLNQVSSKVLIYSKYCAFYKSHYTNWKCIKKNKEAIWMNY